MFFQGQICYDSKKELLAVCAGKVSHAMIVRVLGSKSASVTNVALSKVLQLTGSDHEHLD